MTKRNKQVKPAEKGGGKSGQVPSRAANTSISEHSYSNTKDILCSVCEVDVNDEDPCIQCELCESWFCLECTGMSETFYNEPVSSEHSDNVIFYCNGCRKAIPGVRKVLNTVTLIHTAQENMNKRLQSLEEKVAQKPSELSIDYKLDQAIYDFKEREKRKNNIIIYNLPEPSAEDNETKIEQEYSKIRDICECTEVNSEVETAKRLGEKRNRFSKPRPLKVVLKEENSKHKMLKISQKLKAVQELKTITVTPDYTFRQRQMNKTMKQEVSKRRITDPMFTYRKLKQELQNATLSEVQDLTVEETWLQQKLRKRPYI